MSDNLDNTIKNNDTHTPAPEPTPAPAPEPTPAPAPAPEHAYVRPATADEHSWGGFSQKWAYDRYEEKAKKKGRGVKIFALVMCALFLVTLTSFVTYFIVDRGGIDFFDKTVLPERSDKDQSSLPAGNQSIDGEINKANDRVPTDIAGNYTGEVMTRQEIIKFASPSVVGIKTQVEGYSYFYGTQVYEGVGSGFVLTESGYVVTNFHVIEDAMAIKVILSNGNEYEAELIGADELSDLAVLKISPSEDLIPVIVGDSSAVVAGDSVIAIGCPAGIEFAGTATSGMVSMANREISITDSYGRVQKTMNVIQIDAPINPGNSGGPLLNDRGEVIGINTLKLSSTGYEGIGFALPMNGVMDIVNQLVENGVVVDRGESSYVKGKAALGITYDELTASEAKYYQVPQGVLVLLSTPGGAAQKYGIKSGDIIIAFNDTEIKTASDLIACLEDSNPGDEVSIKVWRDDGEKTISVVLGESS